MAEDVKKLLNDKENKQAANVMYQTNPLTNLLFPSEENSNVIYSILDMADVILIILDKNKIVHYLNKKACNILGYKRENALNKNWDGLFIPERIKTELWTHVEKLFNSQDLVEDYFEKPIIIGNGEERLIGWHNSSIKNDKGEVEYIISSGHDITREKKEEKIQKVILSILEAANTEVNLIDYFKYIHTSVGQLMPVENFYIALYDKEKKLLSFPYFVDKYDKQLPSEQIGNGLTGYVLKTGKASLINSDLDKELVKKGDAELIGSPSRIWLGIPLKNDGNTIGVLVVQDYENENTYGEREKEILEVISYAISRAIEKKRVDEERNELIKKLQDLNISKDKLFSMISHDLRSPFNSLLGFSEILTTEYDTLTHDEIQEYLKVIYDASKNLYGMTNNLLHFSRFQMGRFEYKPERLKLDSMIERCLNLVKGNVVKKQINLSIEVIQANDIFADEDMVSSVLQNLLSNAIKFTNRGGDVTIRSRKIVASNGPNYVEVVVEDTGIGMSEEAMSKIFKDSIYSTPGTEKEYGTGLGLLLVKEFVEKNGGKISVHSQLHKGSSFIFTLPAAP